MSLFLCPSTSRSLWRVVAEGGAATAPRWGSTTTTTTSMRWFSSTFSSSITSATRGNACKDSLTRFRLRTILYAHAHAHAQAQRRTLIGSDGVKVIYEYLDLPKTYRDQKGLPFRKTELSDTEAARLFGPGMKAVAANHLLRILHGRRVAGTLDDPAFAIHTAKYNKGEIAKALEYLRQNVPVNELLNAGMRAEDELAHMEEVKKLAAADKGEGPDDELPDLTINGRKVARDPIYGDNYVDRMRERKIRQQEKQAEMDRQDAENRERMRAKWREKKGLPPLVPSKDGSRELSTEIRNPRIEAYHKAAQSKLEAPPELQPWQRILPSATLVALVIGFLVAVAAVYEEPAPRYRLIPEVTPAQATVGVILGLNVMAFLAWRVPPLWKLLNRAMIFVVATPRPSTLFTAIFSHQRPGHLLANMVPLWYVGTALHDEIGRAQFLALFLGCGSLGFLGSLAVYTMRGWLTVTSLGASGASLGVMSAYFWEHRSDGFRFFGQPEHGVHGIIFLAMIVALQLSVLGKTQKFKVDLASHLSGIAAGVLGMSAIELTKKPREVETKDRQAEGQADGERKTRLTVIDVLGVSG